MMDTWFYILFGLLMLAMVFALIRVIKGPTLPDRVVALDLVAYILIAFLAVFTVYAENIIYIDIILILTMVSFFGTVFIALYLKKQFQDE